MDDEQSWMQRLDEYLHRREHVEGVAKGTVEDDQKHLLARERRERTLLSLSEMTYENRRVLRDAAGLHCQPLHPPERALPAGAAGTARCGCSTPGIS